MLVALLLSSFNLHTKPLLLSAIAFTSSRLSTNSFMIGSLISTPFIFAILISAILYSVILCFIFMDFAFFVQLCAFVSWWFNLFFEPLRHGGAKFHEEKYKLNEIGRCFLYSR